jgi:transposase InsO family protein
VQNMQNRYFRSKNRSEKSQVIDELIEVMGYHRKHAIQVLNGKTTLLKDTPRLRNRPLQYLEAMPAAQKVWEALDYPCAERLQPVLLSIAEHLAAHKELSLDDEIRRQLGQISRATLARRIAKWPTPKPKRSYSKATSRDRLYTQVPVEIYRWDEMMPGALEIDLVEHNGGSSLGHYAYTLTVVDIVTGWNRRRAMLGKSQLAVHGALKKILDEAPFKPWGIHIDNGTEFLNALVQKLCIERKIKLTRSRPYKKNDNAHVEQKNRQFVREIVGYQRYDTPEEVQWLNDVYSLLDKYVNYFLPSRKVVEKERCGAKVRKKYDTARTPFERLVELSAIPVLKVEVMQRERQALNPLELHRRLEDLISQGPAIGETCARKACL